MLPSSSQIIRLELPPVSERNREGGAPKSAPYARMTNPRAKIAETDSALVAALARDDSQSSSHGEQDFLGTLLVALCGLPHIVLDLLSGQASLIFMRRIHGTAHTITSAGRDEDTAEWRTDSRARCYDLTAAVLIG